MVDLGGAKSGQNVNEPKSLLGRWKEHIIESHLKNIEIQKTTKQYGPRYAARSMEHLCFHVAFMHE